MRAVQGGSDSQCLLLIYLTFAPGAARDGTAGTKATAGAAPGSEAGATGSGPAGPSSILPEEM